MASSTKTVLRFRSKSGDSSAIVLCDVLWKFLRVEIFTHVTSINLHAFDMGWNGLFLAQNERRNRLFLAPDYKTIVVGLVKMHSIVNKPLAVAPIYPMVTCSKIFITSFNIVLMCKKMYRRVTQNMHWYTRNWLHLAMGFGVINLDYKDYVKT